MSVLSGTIQPSLLTILSSTSIPSISPLFTTHTDPSLPSDSLITTIQDRDIATPSIRPKHESKGNITVPIIHLQSPNIASTYIQAGLSRVEYARNLSKGKSKKNDDEDIERPLGVEMPWFGMQFRTLGKREMGIEIGLVDSRGREGVVRCTSFKKNPTVHPYRNPPLIHLPLSIPSSSKTTLTPWLTLNLNLTTLIPLFQSLPRPRRNINEASSSASASASSSDDHPSSDPEDGLMGTKKRKRNKKKGKRESELPFGGFGSVSYVRVYANCRLRRIWFSAEGERTFEGMGGGVKDEWGLYAAEAV